MASNPYIRVTELDFDQIKTNIRTFLSSQSQFTDYDFEGSNLSVLVDLLAYNTHYNAILANMASNEMFIDTALKRSSVASIAKHLSYTPRSRRAARATVNVAIANVANGPNIATLERFTRFTTQIGSTTYTFFNPNSYVVEPISGVYSFENVEIVEGRQIDFFWSVPAGVSPAVKFVIPSADVDISTLQVSVQYGGSGSYNETFTEMSDITKLSASSNVYFIEENSEGQYQIYFGDGILGKNLSPGDVVRARYVVTSGSEGNISGNVNLSWFTNTILGEEQNDRYITTISSPTGGQDAETTDQIRFNARNNYVSGNRTVTATDFATAIQQALPAAESVSVWGGEANVPPRYGTVFISIKPYDGYVLTDVEKIRLVTDTLQPRSMPTLQYAFVDPEYTYVGVDVYVKYRTALTTRTAQQLSGLASQKVTEYFSSQLQKFNAGFFASQLQDEIQNMDPSIISSILILRQQKRISPVVGESFSATLQFPGKIHPAELVSTLFLYFNGTNFISAYLGDAPDSNPPNYEGNGVINLYDSATNTVQAALGTVNYGTGRVNITNLNIGGYLGENTIRITTNIQETSRDLLPANKEILVLDDTRGDASTAAINGVSISVVSTTA
jgi:hypothetical protein